MILFWIILASLSVMLLSLSGVIFTSKHFGDWINKQLPYLVSFSSGVFFVVSIGLIIETFELIGNGYLTTLYVGFGALAMWLLSLIFPDGHHHHSDEDCHTHSKRGAHRMLIGDAVHNIADGTLIAPAFIVDIRLGIATTAGIMIHEFIQEVSEFFVLKGAGYSTKKALAWNFVTSGTILIGSVGGFYIASISSIVGPLLGIAAGIFLYTVLVDLIPNAFESKMRPGMVILFALLGVFAIIGTNQVLGGDHAHGDEDDHGIEEAHKENRIYDLFFEDDHSDEEDKNH